MNTIGDRRALGNEIADVFNYAMAEWGETGVPPKDLFARVIELGEGKKGGNANFLQCMAIAQYVVGNEVGARSFVRAAGSEIRLNPRRTFSAWRYLETTANQFRTDLDAIDSLIKGNDVLPAFIARARNLFS